MDLERPVSRDLVPAIEHPVTPILADSGPRYWLKEIPRRTENRNIRIGPCSNGLPDADRKDNRPIRRERPRCSWPSLNLNAAHRTDGRGSRAPAPEFPGTLTPPLCPVAFSTQEYRALRPTGASDTGLSVRPAWCPCVREGCAASLVALGPAVLVAAVRGAKGLQAGGRRSLPRHVPGDIERHRRSCRRDGCRARRRNRCSRTVRPL